MGNKIIDMDNKYIDEEELEWEEHNRILREGTREQIDALKKSWKKEQLKHRKELYDDNNGTITLEDLKRALPEINVKEKKSIYQQLRYDQNVKSYLKNVGIDISFYYFDINILDVFKKLNDGGYWSDVVYREIKNVYLILHKLYLKNDYRPLTDIPLVVDECMKSCRVVKKDSLEIIELLRSYGFLICKYELLTITRSRLVAISLLNTNLKNGKMLKEERLICGVKAIFSLWNECAEKNKHMSKHKLNSNSKLYKDMKKCLSLLFTGRMNHYRYDINWLHEFDGCNTLLKRQWFIEDILDTLKEITLCYQKGYAPLVKSSLPKSLIDAFYDKYKRTSLFLKIASYGVEKIDDALGKLDSKAVSRSQIADGIEMFKEVFYGYAKQYKRYYDKEVYEILKYIIICIYSDYKRFYNFDDVRVRTSFRIEFRKPSFFVEWFIDELRSCYMEPELDMKKMRDNYYILIIVKLESLLGIKNNVLSKQSVLFQNRG